MTREEWDKLKAGSEVRITWHGGNGPHVYTIVVTRWGTRTACDQWFAYVGSFDDAREIVLVSTP